MKPETSPLAPVPPPRTPLTYRWLMRVMEPVEKFFGFTCREFIQLAEARQDRTLSGGEASRYHLHRMVCSLCRGQEKRLKQMNHLAGVALREESAAPEVKLDDAARERIRQQLVAEMKKAK